jgi:hypothetical protein
VTGISITILQHSTKTRQDQLTRQQKAHNDQEQCKDNLERNRKAPLEPTRIPTAPIINPVRNNNTDNQGRQLHSDSASPNQGWRALALPDRNRTGDSTHADARHDTANDHLGPAIGCALDDGADNQPDAADNDQHATTEPLAPYGRGYSAD